MPHCLLCDGCRDFELYKSPEILQATLDVVLTAFLFCDPTGHRDREMRVFGGSC